MLFVSMEVALTHPRLAEKEHRSCSIGGGGFVSLLRTFDLRRLRKKSDFFFFQWSYSSSVLILSIVYGL